QVRVLLVVLAVENVAARRPDAAGEHAVVAEAVLDEIPVIRPVIRAPEDHLLAAAGPVGKLVAVGRLRAPPADSVRLGPLFEQCPTSRGSATAESHPARRTPGPGTPSAPA